MENESVRASADTEPDLHIDPDAGDVVTLDPSGGDEFETTRPWRLAESLKTLLKQVNDAYPGRNKASDGTIGDARHRTRPSDHNPHIIEGAFGVVSALDITHDPANGCDAGRMAHGLRDSHDARIKYIIWNRKIANASAIGSAPAWAWRAYTGANPHNKHCHISVKRGKALFDDPRPWVLPSVGELESAIATEEDDPEALIANAIAAIGGSKDKPLLQVLINAQESIAVLLARHAQAMREDAAGASELEGPPPDPEVLGREYLDLWSTCRMDPTRSGEVAWYRATLLKGRPRYEEVAERTGAPWWFVGIVHALEASFSFAGHLHNGDPLTARTVQVPRGRPVRWNPPSDWVSSAVDAITHDGNAGLSDWRLAQALFRFEKYNGFGYRPLGIHSPYLWSFSNHYTRGKFVADGHFSPSAVSKQCGAAVMVKALANAGDLRIDD